MRGVRALWDFATAAWPTVTTAAAVALALVASAHAILRKREVRASIGWVAFIWALPFGGALLYAALGINRLARRAGQLHPARLLEAPPLPRASLVPADELPEALAGYAPLATLVERVTGMALLTGNRVEPLDGGDAAYGAMIAAIERAERTVAMSTYIFDVDEAGERFADALAAASERGVTVRVLIDGVGANYSRPTMVQTLRRRGVRTAAFLSPALPWRLAYANLRNHRKVLVVDGAFGFTGGMNVRAGCLSGGDPSKAIGDLHFAVEGPVVAELVDAFAEDWAFTTGERLSGDAWYPSLAPRGEVLARTVPDGPDEHLDKLRWTLLGAIGQARRRIGIVTPYFLPDAGLQSALAAAALRGVQVDLVLPAKNNLRVVQWAQTAELWSLLERGCRVWLSAPPFDHTKLMVVDEHWSCVGSSNWDPRSLRLNFELNVECYDRALARALTERLEARIARATRYTIEEHRARPLPVALRDGLARLFTPYL
jgi:cardiolipin synthase